MPRRNSKFMTVPGIGKMSRAKKGKRVERFDAGAPGRLKHHRLTLGFWPTLGVAQAREKARRVKSDVKSGIDPKATRAAAQAAAKAEAQAEAI